MLHTHTHTHTINYSAVYPLRRHRQPVVRIRVIVCSVRVRIPHVEWLMTRGSRNCSMETRRWSRHDRQRKLLERFRVCSHTKTHFIFYVRTHTHTNIVERNPITGDIVYKINASPEITNGNGYCNHNGMSNGNGMKYSDGVDCWNGKRIWEHTIFVHFSYFFCIFETPVLKLFHIYRFYVLYSYWRDNYYYPSSYNKSSFLKEL